jgi:hypothetical protein
MKAKLVRFFQILTNESNFNPEINGSKIVVFRSFFFFFFLLIFLGRFDDWHCRDLLERKV